MAISTINQAGLNAPLTLTAPVLNSPVISGTPTLPTGSVIQVVYASTTASTTVASTSFADTSLGGTITPKFSTSKILIQISQAYFATRTATSVGQGIQILRNGSVIISPDEGYQGGYLEMGNTTYAQTGGREFLQYQDSPASTSALTYKTQGRVNASSASGQCIYQYGGHLSTIVLMEIAG